MHMQFPRPPVFLGQIDQTTKPIRHGVRAGFGHRQGAGCQEIFRPAVDLVGIGAGSEVELRDAGADEMVVPERQPLGSNRLAGRVLHVDAAGQEFSGVEIKNFETKLCAMCRDGAGPTQNRKQQVLPKHDFRCSGNSVVQKLTHCSNFSRMAVLPAAQGEGVWGAVSFLRTMQLKMGSAVVSTAPVGVPPTSWQHSLRRTKR